MHPLINVLVRVGRRNPRMTAVPLHGFPGPNDERSGPDWAGRSTRIVPPTAGVRSRAVLFVI
jgi:hypothetical protein